ncbi:hypothetical protein DPMN_157405 [Dreissena polymorpha]|uniref:Uncharacterized protein n=1 Tax=Dreissena polymorpha TaxID=45954 RepID=A0A9D4INU6_DREPO|nr:hypothetical protein DPMN_157405 [Dreissena polymorpha]
MSKFHEDWEKNVSSRLFTFCHYIHIKKTAPLPGTHVFSLIMTIFKLVRDIHITNINIRKKTPPGGHVFLPIQTIIELNCPIQMNRSQDGYKKNALPLGSHVFQAKFHEDRKINMASRVLTRKIDPPPYIIGMNLLTMFHEDRTINVASRMKNAPPLRQPCFSSKHSIETNLLTKLHEDWTINVASRELTSQMLTPHNARQTTD